MPEIPRDLQQLTIWKELTRSKSAVAGLQFSEQPPSLSRERQVELLLQAHADALSTEPERRQHAFDVAARISLTAGPDDGVALDMALAVMLRLGNFASAETMQRHHPNWAPNIPFQLRIEALAKAIENTADPNLNDIFTDFQRDLNYTLLTHPYASVGAPTSAGKSFVLSRVIRHLLSSGPKCIIYLVPTRALIHEVSIRLRKQLRDNNLLAPIRTTPIPFTPTQRTFGAVYILTQERVLALIHNDKNTLVPIDALFVDEAQNIQEGGRGILLETAIEAVRKANPNCRIYFTSPPIKNPQRMLKGGTLKNLEGPAHLEATSPVTHNRISANFGKAKGGKPSLVIADLSAPTLPIASIALEGKLPKNNYSKRAIVALHAHQPNSTTIVYTGKKDYAEDVAEEIAKLAGVPARIDERVASLAEYVRTHLHPRHPLVELLKSNVAVHYRTLPAEVRTRIEELAAAGVLDFVCCTSTLLQGVNLRCRSIVLLDPTKGNDPLRGHEVQNLAGRAGRLDSDLHGNVWIVNPDDWKEPTHSDREPVTIRSSYEIQLEDGGTILQRYLAKEVPEKQKPEAAAALGRSLQLLRSGMSVADFVPNVESAQETVKVVTTQLLAEQTKLTVPTEILNRHAGMDPLAIDRLYNKLSKQAEEDPEEVFRLYAPYKGRLEDKTRLFAYLSATLTEFATEFEQPLSEHQIKRLALLASKWIRSIPMVLILGGACDNAVESEQRKAAKAGKTLTEGQVTGITRRTIRGTLETLEDEIRFKMVQRYRTLVDILISIYTSLTPDPAKVAEIQPIHIFMEFGTTRPLMMDLLGLGFARGTAIELAEQIEALKFKYEDSNQILEWLVKQQRSTIKSWKLSPEAWLEIALVSNRDPNEIDWTPPPEKSTPKS